MLGEEERLTSVVRPGGGAAPAAQPQGGLQFMDTSNFSQSAGHGGGHNTYYTQGPGGAGGYGANSGPMDGPMSFDNEPPLLEELGIDFDKIYLKTISVLNPFKKVTRDMMYSNVDGQQVADSDMAGPLLIALALGATMLLRGKVHFGYIYGVGLVGCITLWLVMTLMSEHGIDIYQTSSILGYCLLPMVLLSFFSAIFSATGHVMTLLLVLTIGWCTLRSSEMMVISMGVQNEKALVAYPIGLFYACFALISVF